MKTGIQRLFWGWEAPVLEKAVAFLCDGWDQIRALDLSDTLILVPNGEAGRRLREALAQETHLKETAAVVPHLWLPEQALLPQSRRFEAATPLQAQMAWQRALERIDLAALSSLFPKLPAERGWGWHAETARMLADLKMLLGTGGLTLAHAAAMPPVQRDAARWRDLAVIERAYSDELAQAALADAQALKLRNARSPLLPDGVKRIVVIASPDLPPLLDDWFAVCAERGLEVIIAVHAPQALQHSFDRHGRPLTAHWGEDADVVLPVSSGQIHVMRDPAMQAGKALDLLRDLVPQQRTALGVCDAEVGSLLLEKLTLENARSFEPGGIPVQREGLWHVLDCFRVLLGSGSWRAFAALLRVGEFRNAFVPAEAGTGDLLRQADEFAIEHLPVTLAHAAGLPLADDSVLKAVIHATLELLDTLRRQPPSKAARLLMMKLLGEKEFRPTDPQQHARTELVAEWLRIAEELENESARFGLKPKAEDVFSLSLDLLAQSRLAEPRGDIDLVLQGWLELLWEKVPNLVVTGLNEEHVPGIFISHPFLPDALRQELQLPSQQTRFARDAFILAALSHQRAALGRLELLCGQWSEDGDALRPSRLLFLCDDQTLPERVGHLFPKEDSQEVEAEPPRTLAWSLKPDWNVQPLKNISPSRLRAYLTCPFRYYLSHSRHMEAVETQKRELDAAEFGQIIHGAFQQMYEDPDMRGSTHEGQIAAFLEEAARQHVSHEFGRRPAPLVTLQMESIVQRLRQAAQVEAKNRQEGWEWIGSELKIGREDDVAPLLLAGVPLTGRIDRVERNTDGTIRIVDFKTSDKADDSAKRHFKILGPRSKLAEADEWKCFDLGDGRRGLWLDLQLPLYVAAMRLRGHNVTRAAYFVLPKSIQETAILEWKDFDEGILTAALACGDEAVKRIQAGQFWPPAERSPDASFDEILLYDPLHSVQPPLA